LDLIIFRNKLKEKGVKIRIIGNVSLLPKDIIEIISEAELMTKDNNKTQLNVAFSYTGIFIILIYTLRKNLSGIIMHYNFLAQDEITKGVNVVLNGLNTGSLNEEDLNLNLFSHCLYTHGSIPDLIIRTSGETRLSDFLLFQVNKF
jgi:ditrans,polycis-polyprenyl diphosphate synthase